MSALTGMRVVELASERIAYAGKLLGDMGADVVLVEPPGGEPSRGYPPFVNDEPMEDGSLYWWHYNTSKRSVVLDLERDAARDAFKKLVASADVLIESETPGRLAELGLDYDTLSKIKPDLIHVSMTPFGRSTSRKDEPVVDLTILAGGGPVWSCGYDDHSLPPVRGAGNQAQHTASLFALTSLLVALLEREQSGLGQHVAVDMHAAANVTTEMASYHWLVWQGTVQRLTGRHASERPTLPSQVCCADGSYVTTGVPPRNCSRSTQHNNKS